MSVFTINNIEYTFSEHKSLLRFLRENLGITSAKCGCEQGACGTCSVIIDGKLVKACTVFTDKLDGKNILTTEGLTDYEKDVYSYAFSKEGAVQCGFCLPAMVLATKVLLDNNVNPTEQEIRKAIKNNLCRCTGYVSIVRAIKLAAKIFREKLDYTENDFNARIDARSKILGETKFVADDVPKHALYGLAVIANIKHGIIEKLDVEKAKKLPGVCAVITRNDIPGRVRSGSDKDDWRILVGEKEEVLFNGDVIALIAAENREIAEKASKIIEVEYKRLNEICTLNEAVAGGKMFIDVDIDAGDMKKAVKNTKYFVSNSFKAPYAEHGYMELESACASFDGKKLVINSADQGIYRTRERISKSLNISEENILVKGYPVGGAFGGREDVVIQIQASLLAYYTKRTVFLQYTREQSLKIHAKRHEMFMVVTTGCDENGLLTYLDMKLLANKGAYSSIGAPVLKRACAMAPGPYRYQAVKINGKSFFSNNTPSGSYRGFGITQCCFAVESNLNILAEKAKISPWKIRYINALKPGDAMYNGQIANDSTAIIECLEKVKDIYENEPYAGIACAIKNCASGNGLEDIGRCNLLVKNKKIHVISSAGRVGQGIETALVQIVANTTNIDKNDIIFDEPITGISPDTGTCSASRLAMLTGEAALKAANSLKTAINTFGLEKLEGKTFVGEFVSDTKAEGPNFHEDYAYACHVVCLDENANIKKIIAAHDVGVAINPLNVKSQIEGGVVMSVGYALTEHFQINDEKYLAKIGLPTAVNSPDVESIIIEKPSNKRMLKAKGVGEITAIPTPAALAMAYKKLDGKERFALPLKESWLWIDPDRCVGCSMCVRNCPRNAIDAALIIDTTKCVRCDICLRHCWFGAISERFDTQKVDYHSKREDKKSS